MTGFDLTFHEEDAYLAAPVFISGTFRSGTTLLGNIIGSLTRIEYEYEPWLLEQVPVLLANGQKGLVESDKFQQYHLKMLSFLIEGYLRHILLERVRGRRLNFRLTDDTRVWKQLPMDEVFRRWNDIQNRFDVRREIRSQGLRLAVKMPGLSAAYEFLLRTFPECQFIEIVRHGFDVARSIVRKHWFDDQGLAQVAIPKRYAGDGKIVPWWVEEDLIPEYLSWSEATRALFYWRHFVTSGLEEQERLSLDETQFLRIRFEDLVRDPEAVLDRITSFLGDGIEKTYLTAALLSEIDPTRAVGAVAGLEDDVESAEFAKAIELLVALGYEI